MRLPLIATVILGLASCSSGSVYPALKQIESYLQERPDSALTVLQSIDSTLLTTPAEKAKYSLLMTMAKHKNYLPLKDTTTLSPAVEYYCRDSRERALTQYYKGIILFNNEEYNPALPCFNSSLELFEKYGMKKYKAMALSFIGLTYDCCHNKYEELSYAERAYDAYKEMGDTSHYLVALLNLALAYNNNRRYNEADSVLSVICSVADTSDYTIEGALLLKNDINLRSDNPDPKLSIKILEDVRDKGHGLNLEAYCQYAYALLLDGQEDRSNKLLEQLLAAGAAEDLDCLFTLFRIEKKKGDSVKALEYKEAIDSLSDKYVVRMLEQSLFRAQAENASLKEAKARIALRHSRIMGLLFCVILLLVLVTLYCHYRHRNRILQQEIDRLIITRDSVAANLQGMEEVQKTYYLAVLPIFKEIEAFFRVQDDLVIEQMKAERANKLSTELDRLVDEANNEGFGKFEDLLNERLNGVMNKLRSDFPNLSERDYRLLGYSFAGFKDSTIAILLHQNPSSLRSQKSRLKERIRCSDTENAAFLRSLC